MTIPLFGLLANRIGSARVVWIGALGTLLIAFPMYFLLQFATFAILVGTMIIGGILPTLAWAGLGGLMADIFGGPVRYSALSIAYAVAATLSGFVPIATQGLADRHGCRVVAPGRRARDPLGDHARLRARRVALEAPVDEICGVDETRFTNRCRRTRAAPRLSLVRGHPLG